MRSTLYYASVTLKRTYFMAVIDEVFCLDACVINNANVKRCERSEIMGTYSIPENRVKS